jgi:hypothetical protein
MPKVFSDNRAPIGASIGTTFPSSPVDGQSYHYVADATNGVVWQFIYRAASASSYKWEFVGGAPLLATVNTPETTASTSYADPTTPGPTVTTPLAGDYLVDAYVTGSHVSTAAATFTSFSVGASAASDDDSLRTDATTTAAPHRRILKAAVAAASAITMKYKVASGTGSFAYRTIAITPVRVSG